jgi:ABC-type sugar transport system ATPase subunit
MIAVEDIDYCVGNFRLSGISFQVPTAAYGVLMGRTGCGKTSVLEVICGLRPIRRGRVLLNGRNVTRVKAANRGVGYVPQDLALFPTHSVRDHLAFAPKIRRMQPRVIRERVAELANLLGIGYLLDRKPLGLSGGEAQRVALGRALTAHPSVLCLDEPLSALDEETRDEMAGLLKSVQKRMGVTVLHVTHSPTEAKKLADTIITLHGEHS